MNQKEWNQKLQLALGLTPDGVFGPITQEKSSMVEVDLVVKPLPQIKPLTGDYFGAPWIGSYSHLLGRDEEDPALNAALVPEWAKEGLPGYKTLAGNEHAWCSVLVNASFRRLNIIGTNSAAAASWRTWGESCPYWFGSVLGIRHATGRGHVCYFLYWIDESKRVAACYGGNQNNKLSVAAYDISGNARGHDEPVNGPRWPKNYADGVSLTKAEVLAKYPNLKVGGVGGSTT